MNSEALLQNESGKRWSLEPVFDRFAQNERSFYTSEQKRRQKKIPITVGWLVSKNDAKSLSYKSI